MDIDAAERSLVELPPIAHRRAGGPRERLSTGSSIIAASGSRREITKAAS